VGLFDDDDAVKPSIEAYRNLVLTRTDGKTKTRFAKLKPSSFLINLKRKNFNVPLALEELYPIDAWFLARKNEWLVRRENMLKTYGYTKTDVAFDHHLNRQLKNEGEVLVVTSCVSSDHKERLAKYVAKKIRDEQCSWDFSSLQDNMKTVLDKLR